MIFTQIAVAGAFVIDIEPYDDERGFFARTYCRREFAEHGIDFEVVQTSLAYNAKAGTLRGMHFQRQPHAEKKIVRCTSGSAWDVLVDMRYESPTFMKWTAVELSADDRRSVFVPELVAHGYVTLEDDTELLYDISVLYEPTAAAGIRWDDPAIAIEWPRLPEVLSDRDASFPDLDLPTATKITLDGARPNPR